MEYRKLQLVSPIMPSGACRGLNRIHGLVAHGSIMLQHAADATDPISCPQLLKDKELKRREQRADEKLANAKRLKLQAQGGSGAVQEPPEGQAANENGDTPEAA